VVSGALVSVILCLLDLDRTAGAAKGEG